MPTERPDFLPAHNSEYLQAAYWEKRFQQVCEDDIPMHRLRSTLAVKMPRGPPLSRAAHDVQPWHEGTS